MPRTTKNPPKPTAAAALPLAAIRAFWLTRAGLGGTPEPKSLATVFEKFGWARSLGGVDAYLAVHARRPSTTRKAIDAAVAKGTLLVNPAARGCMYLLPATIAPAAMALAAALTRPRTSKDLERAGATWEEVHAVAKATAAVLAGGPLTTAGVRKALPEGVPRSLGERGKKVGLASVLSVALRELEFDGRITRTPVEGRIDTEHYEWRLATSSPGKASTSTRVERIAAVIDPLLGCAGPVTLGALAQWLGAPQREVKAALASLEAQTVEVETLGTAWVRTRDVDALAAATVPADNVRLLPFIDAVVELRGGPGPLVDPAHHGRPVIGWGSSTPKPLGSSRSAGYRALLVGSQLAGFWEYDPGPREIVWTTFDKLPKKLARTVDEAAARTRDFLRDVGHGRSFSLDTDDALSRRAAEIRGM